MHDFKVSYLPSIIILLFLIRLGESQHSNGGDISSALKRLLEIKRTSPQGGVKYNITSSAELHNIVNTRFRTEMAVLFSRLPKSDQCNILVAVSETTQCTVPDIIELLFSLTEMKQNINVSCPVRDRNKLKMCSQANRTFIGETFCNELLIVFKSLPSPFKCHVINAIALRYSLKGRRNLALSVSQTQNAVAEIFPSVNLPNTCADLEMDRIIPSIPPVNVTVALSNADKQTWLQTLTKKGPEIYKTVLKYEYDMSHPGKLWNPTSLAQHLKEHEVNSTQLVTVGVEGGSGIFSVLFRLKVKRKRLREIRSTYRIVAALTAKKQELREILNATIINISLGGERSNVKTAPETGKWTVDQMDMAKMLFPANLSEYYKQLGKPARCFVVFYISLKIDKSPKALEMFYSSFKRLSRKHTCYYTGRTGSTDTPIFPVVTHERFTKNNTSQSTQAFSIERTGKPSTASDGAIDHVSDKVDTEDLSSLEITLFALLGVLCACVLAFTINCVMLALKVKPTDQSNGRAKPMLHTAVFHKSTSVAGCKETECVHFTDTLNDSSCQPSNTEHPPKAETVVYNDKSCNCLCLISGSTPHNIRRCDLNNTCLKSSQPVLHDKIGAKRTNSKTQLENDYCLSPVVRTFDSSQLCADDTAENCPSNMEKTSKSKCQCPRRTLDSRQGDDRVLESQGKAISYCSISDTSYKEHLCPKMKHNGCLPTEESHATVIVMLDCKGFKEAQV